MAVANTPLRTPARGLRPGARTDRLGPRADRRAITSNATTSPRKSSSPSATTTSPEHAPRQQYFAAAVQVADYLVRHIGIACGFEQVEPVDEDSWTSLSGWKILYGDDQTESKIARASLANTLQRLPAMLSGLV